MHNLPFAINLSIRFLFPLFFLQGYHFANTFKAKQINFVGAGDAFLSAFVNAIDDEKDIEQAITAGSFNASNVIQKYGAKEGITGKYPPENMKLRIAKSKITI